MVLKKMIRLLLGSILSIAIIVGNVQAVLGVDAVGLTGSEAENSKEDGSDAGQGTGMVHEKQNGEINTDLEEEYTDGEIDEVTKQEMIFKQSGVGNIVINEINFPDPVFREYVKESFDLDNNGILSIDELTDINYISVSDQEISSLQGIKLFSNLKTLYFSNTSLTSLDISGATALISLYCVNNNYLIDLDASGTTALETIVCDDNKQLVNLDVSGAIVLEGLRCEYNNNLSYLNISGSGANTLEYIYCNNSSLNSLDVSGATALRSLYCARNKITHLDLSANKALEILSCSSNNLPYLDISNNLLLSSLQTWCDKNVYKMHNSSIDTTTIEGFDINKTSDWTNAIVEGTIVTIIDPTEDITYSYQIRKGETKIFAFRFEAFEDSNPEMIDKSTMEEISDFDLFAKYPEYLKNDSVNKIENYLSNNIQKSLDNAKGDDFWSAYKYCLNSGGFSVAVQDFFSSIGFGDSSYDEFVNDSISTFVNTICENETFVQEIVSKSLEKLEPLKSIIDIGDKIDEGDKEYWATAIGKSDLGMTEKQASSLLSQCDSKWGEISKVLGAANKSLKFGEVVISVLALQDIKLELISDLCENLSTNSALFQGLKKMEQRIKKNPVQEIIETYLKAEGLSMFVGAIEKKMLDSFAESGNSKTAVVFFAKLSVKTISHLMPIASADTVVKAITQHMYTNILIDSLMTNQVHKFLEYKQSGKGSPTFREEMEKYEMFYNVYLKSLQLDIDLAKKVTNKHGKTLLDNAQHILDSYNYKKYIQLCKDEVRRQSGSNLKFKLNDDGNVTISGQANSTNTRSTSDNNTSTAQLVIPSTIQNYNVVEISDAAFKGNTAIEYLIVEKGTQKIGAEAFSDCTNLKAVYLADTVEIIEENAFANCSDLKIVQLGNGVVSIGNNTFTGDTSLSNITIPSSVTSISENAFKDTGISYINGVSDSVSQQIAENMGIEFTTIAPVISSLNIINMPSKIEYYADEQLNTEGMVLEATYEDGTKETVTSDWYAVFNDKHLGENEIHVFYKNSAASYNVQIRSSLVKYTVQYVNEYGYHIAEVQEKTGELGSTVTENAIDIGGYEPDEDSLNYELLIGENIMTISYHKISVPQPTNLTIKAEGASSITINWTGNDSISAYEVYYSISKDGDFKKIGEATDTRYTHKDLIIGQTYYYKVQCYITVNGIKYYSEFTDILSLILPVPKPAGLMLKVASASSVKISWTKVTGATGYEIYYATSEEGKYSKVKSVTETSYTQTGLTADKTYYYKIRAYKTISKNTEYSSYSAVKSKKLTVPTPANVKLTNSSANSLKISWSKVSGSSGYQIYRATSKNGTYKNIKTVISETTVSHTDKSLINGKIYYYKVRAYKTVDGSKKYSSFCSVVSKKVTLAKTSLTATAKSNSSIKLSWTKVAGAKNYEIYRATSKNGSYKKIKTTTSLTYTNTKLKSNKTYYYKVKAVQVISKKTYRSAYSEVQLSKTKK